MTEKVKIKATLEWANLSVPNEMSGKYQVDLCNLSKEAVEAIEGLGLTVRYREDKPEKGNFITAKSARPIKAYTDGGDAIDVLVGNGSKATVVLGTYEWEFKKKKGVSASIQRLVVTDLVTYEEGGDGDEDGEDAV